MQEAQALFVSRISYTHFLTLSFAQKDEDGHHMSGWPVSARAAELKKRLEIFMLRMDRRVLGCQRCRTDKISYYAAFEDETKGHNRTHFHAHVLLVLNEENVEAFERHWERVWRRLNFNSNVLKNSCLKAISDPVGVAYYAVKQSRHDPIIRLSAEHETMSRERYLPNVVV